MAELDLCYRLDMANGGWYGTQEQWRVLEAPLLRVDALIERFASNNGLRLTKNDKDWPGRSLHWGDNPSCLIQIYLAGEDSLTWNLWLCCSQDRGHNRYWRKEFAIQEQQMDQFITDLPQLLENGFFQVESWRAAPEQLEFATTLTSLPDR